MNHLGKLDILQNHKQGKNNTNKSYDNLNSIIKIID